MKKKGNKKMPRQRQEIINNPIPTSLFTCYAAVLLFLDTGDAVLRTLVNVYTIEKQRCRDRVINDFLSWSRHLLVPLLFHEPYIPLHFREMIFPLVPHTFLFGAEPQ